MYQTVYIVGIVLAVLSAGCLAASIAMFFGFRIPTIWKDSSGSLEQKQIEEIRQKSSEAASQRGKVDVFSKLEKQVKVRRANTHSLNVGPTTAPNRKEASMGTALLRRNAPQVNPDFVIEKNIVFVSTDEVI